MSVARTVLTVICFSALVSCGSDGVSSSSGIDKSKTMTGLSAAEKATFCDWMNAVGGGYNHFHAVYL